MIVDRGAPEWLGMEADGMRNGGTGGAKSIGNGRGADGTSDAEEP